MFKGLDMIIAKEQCNIGFKLNAHRALFYHKMQLKLEEIVSDNAIGKEACAESETQSKLNSKIETEWKEMKGRNKTLLNTI